MTYYKTKKRFFTMKIIICILVLIIFVYVGLHFKRESPAMRIVYNKNGAVDQITSISDIRIIGNYSDHTLNIKAKSGNALSNKTLLLDGVAGVISSEQQTVKLLASKAVLDQARKTINLNTEVKIEVNDISVDCTDLTIQYKTMESKCSGKSTIKYRTNLFKSHGFYVDTSKKIKFIGPVTASLATTSGANR